MTPTTESSTAPSNARRRWFAGVTGVTGLAALTGIGLLGAPAQSHAWGRGGGLDPEERARRMEWRIGKMVKAIGGTAQQQEQLVAIARTAMAELRPLRDQRRQARLRGLELLAVPVIDRRALEQARATQMQMADAASRRMVQAMADGAEVLTPEQRVKVAAHMKQRMERRRG
jgi:protein CpxP